MALDIDGLNFEGVGKERAEDKTVDIDGLNFEGIGKERAEDETVDIDGLNFEGIRQEREGDKTAPLRSIMGQSVKLNPDDSAKIIETSSRIGVDPTLVKTKPEEFAQKEILDSINFDDLVTSSPGTSNYLNNTEGASVSHDDVSSLRKIENALRDAFVITPIGGAFMSINDIYEGGKVFEGSGRNIVNSFGNMIDGFIMQQMSNEPDAQSMNLNPALVDDPFIQEMLFKNVERSQPFREDVYQDALARVIDRTDESQEITPSGLSMVQEGVRAGLESLVQLAPAVGLAALTRSGRVGILAVMGSEVYTESYATGREKGLTNDEATMYSLLQSSIEVYTELIPLKTLAAIVSTPAGSRTLQSVINFMVQEGLTENLSTLGQTAVNYGYDLDEELKNAKTPSEMLAIQMHRQGVTTIATIVGGGTQIGLAATGSKIVNTLLTEEERQQARQAQEQFGIDNIAEAVEESKTKKRSPTMMKRFMQQAATSNTNEIFMDAVQTKLYLNSLSQDAIEADPTLKMLSLAVQNNDSPNGDLVIPMSEFATSLVGNEHYKELRPHMKLSTATETPFRQEAENQQRTDHFTDVIAKADKAVAENIETKKLFEDVKNELVATGQVTPKLAKYYAELIPAYATVKADELDTTPSEVYKQMGLKIKGPYAEREQALSEGYVLKQDLIVTPQFKKWFKNSEVVDDSGKPLVMYHGSKESFDTFDYSKIGLNATTEGQGFYFTDDKSTAAHYAEDGNLKSVYLNIEKAIPLDMKAFDVGTVKKIITELSNAEAIKHGTLIEDGMLSNVGDVRSEGYNKVLNEAANLLSDNETAVDQIGDLVNSGSELELVAEAVKKVTGYDGIKSSGFSNEGAGGGKLYIALNPNQVKSATQNDGNYDLANASIFGQGADGQFRGLYDVSNVIIRLGESSDASTFLHEFAHFMLDMERKTKGPQMTPVVEWWRRNTKSLAKEAKVDEKIVQAWLDDPSKVTPEQAQAVDGATHEQFARSFEAYIMEGKAPTLGLRNAFRVFARLLKSVYDSVKGGFKKSNIDAEMRQVFDRLLATEEQILTEEARSLYVPLFTDAAMAGMTEAQYKKYKQRGAKASDKATETVRDKIMREAQRNTKEWWQRELEDRAIDKLADLSKTQVYATREKIISDEQYHMDRSATKDLLGVKKIPRELYKMTATSKRGKRNASPDELAPLFGYGSGLEMLNDITEAKPIKQVAREQAEADMLAEHGDIMNDGSLDQIIQDAVRNDQRAELILTEIKQLSTNRPVIDKATLKHLADVQIGKRSLAQIKPNRYRRAEIRSAQDAAVAMREGRKDDALRGKTQQLMNMYLWQSAMAAREQGEKITKYVARFNKTTVRKRIGKAGNGYLDQILGLLDRFEFRKNVSIKKAQENAQPIQMWLNTRTEDGDNIILSLAALDEKYGRHWKEVPIDELTGIYESILSIEHNANSANNIVVAEETLTFEQAVNRGLNSMSKVKNVFTPQRSDVIDKKNPVSRYVAEQTKIPFLTSWLDGGERIGVMHDLIMEPINKALHHRQELWEEVGKTIIKALEGRSKKTRKRHDKKVYIREIVSSATDMHTGHDGNLYGEQILAVALNTGNKSNLTKMLIGEGWATEEGGVSMDNPQLQAVLKHMTKEDWDLVQTILDQIGLLYPKLAKLHERTSGLPLARVPATPIVTPYGTYPGGYYPVKYDANRSQRAAMNEEKANEQSLSMLNSSGVLLPSVSTGARIERTAYVGPIKLSLEAVQEHLNEVIHFISHYEAVRQVHKIINDPQIAEAIIAKMGKSEYDILKPWLNDVAKDGRSTKSKGEIERLLGRFRNGVTLGVMGYKATTILIQLSGIFNTMAETGPLNVLRATRSILGSDKTIQEAYDYAFANSKVLKFRVKTMDRELNNVLTSLEGKSGLLNIAQRYAMMGIALMQTFVVDIVSWYAGYIKGMKVYEGDQTRAFKYADWVIDNIQGSGNIKDMSAVMRDKHEAWRMFTMFMTFFSALGNNIRDAKRGYSSNQYSLGSVASKAMFMLMLPAIYETLMREGIPDLDDDDEIEKFVDTMIFNAAMMPIATQPIIRDLANAVPGDYNYNASPLTMTLGKGAVATSSMLYKLASGDEETITKAQLKNFSLMIAAWYKVPGTRQVWASGEYITELLVDGEDYSTRQLLFGPDRD